MPVEQPCRRHEISEYGLKNLSLGVISTNVEAEAGDESTHVDRAEAAGSDTRT